MGNTPNIRFKGFDEDWEQRKLSEIATMHARIGWQNLRTSEFLDSGDYMLITGTDFEDGTINYSTCHYVEKERYEQDKNIQIRNGSILITKDGTLGKVAYVQGLTMPATLNAGVFNVEIKDKKETDEKYLFQYLKAPFLMDYVTRHATGGTIKHLNQSILINFPVYMPKKSEQEKIGLYLMQLDSLITLHQRKCQETKKLKEYMLQKMFPPKGEKIPEIRFAGFTGDWEQRKLGEVAKYRRGSFPQPYGNKEWYGGDGAMPFVQVADVTDEMNLVTDTKLKISKKAQPMSVYAEKNSVLVTLQGSIGRVAITQYGAFVDRTVLIFEEYNEQIDNAFWAYIIKQKFIEEARKAPGGTIKTITKEALSGFDLTLPSYDEQVKLGIYFQSLDSLITLHQCKVRELTELKNYMLQNMFPKKGGKKCQN